MICLTLTLLCAPAQLQLTTPFPPAVAGATTAADLPDERIEVYDVRDLTGQDRIDALARDIVSDTVSTETRIVLLERYRELIEEGAARKAMENIVNTVQTLIAPPLSGEAHKVQALGDGTFTLVGTDEQHAWTRAYLAGQRSFEGFLDVGITVMQLPTGQLDAVFDGRSSLILSPEARGKLLQLDHAMVTTSPRVMVQPSQRASLSVLDQTSYIKDFRLVVVEPDLEVVDPVIDVLSTGLEFDVLAAPMEAGHVTLSAELRLSSAPRPFKEAKLQLGAAGQEVTVQLPEVTSTRIEGRFSLPFGHLLALRGVSGSERKEEVLLLLEVQHAAKPR